MTHMQPIDWPFNADPFHFPLSTLRQHGACGFLSIILSRLPPFWFPFPFVTGVFGLQKNAKHRFSPPQKSCQRDLGSILCTDRLNQPHSAPVLWCCCTHGHCLASHAHTFLLCDGCGFHWEMINRLDYTAVLSSPSSLCFPCPVIIASWILFGNFFQAL